jgi:hypothetical protein
MLVEDMSRNVFFGFKYHMFSFLYLFVPYLLTLPPSTNACMRIDENPCLILEECYSNNIMKSFPNTKGS